jgi:DNA polymerase-3 subunit beta
MSIFISFNQSDLQRVLGVCNQISPKRSDVEIFTYTRIDIQAQEATFSTLNANAFYQAKLNSQNLDNAQSYSLLVKTDVLTNTVNLIQDDVVSFDIQEGKNTLLIQGSKAKHTLRFNTELVDNFKIPEKKTETVQAQAVVPTSDFAHALKNAFISVGQKNVYDARFLNVCLTVDASNGNFFVVSTDRYRISKTKVLANLSNLNDTVKEEKTNFLTLPKGLQFLLAAVNDQQELTLEFLEDYIWIQFGAESLTLRYGEGSYPEYDKIIPQTFTCEMSFNTSELLAAFKQVYFFAKANTVNKSVELTVKPADKKLILKSHTDDGFASESEVNINNYQGNQDDWSQSFNSDYLMDYISQVSTENILWEANPGKPSVLSPEGKKAEEFYLASGLR